MKVKVHDWNLPANERIILTLTEHNYHLNFIGFLIKPLPSALTCSTTAVNLLPRTGICFSLSTKVFISILDVCEEHRAGTLSPLFLWELFYPLPLSITHNKFALTWLPINYPVSCRSMMWWAHLRASSPEWEQAPSHVIQIKLSGRWQVVGMFWKERQSIFLFSCVYQYDHLTQQFYLSNFLYRLALLRYFLLNVFVVYFFTYTKSLSPENSLFL